MTGIMLVLIVLVGGLSTFVSTFVPAQDRLTASSDAETESLSAATAGNTPIAETTAMGDAWTDPRNPIVQLFGGQRLELWSLKPIRRPAIPVPTLSASESIHGSSPIDTFVHARLNKVGLTQNPPADRRTLIRRLAFDLTGLPPDPALVERYLADDRPDAYVRLVDELLSSPYSGQHQARFWLDVVRYSDSNGFDWDEFRPEAWRYRDYVVTSFNADKPFDQFICEQLAGDELFAGPPSSVSEQESLIATGFLRLGPQDNAAGLFNEQDRARSELLADVVETTGSAFLGMTLSCCRCHDHKYDPLSQADHYRLRAFFAAMTYGDELSIDLADAQQEIETKQTRIDARIDEVEQALSQLTLTVRARLMADKSIEPIPDDVTPHFTETEKEQHEKLTDRKQTLEKTKPRLQRALLMTDAPEEVPATHILFQGDHRAPREEVAPGFLSILEPGLARIETPTNPRTRGRRLTLARWIGAPTNPLTARVLANRIWQQLFGQGLVETPNDFGLAGAEPSNPELLDWLASELQANGWSIKALQREIVLSATYQQSSASQSHQLQVDVQNRWLSRQNVRRLTAEQLRDALLRVSGLLNSKHGGAPIWPDLPAEILQANPAFLDDNETKTKGWYPSPASEQWGRSIYLVQKRGMKVPFLETFDLPENSVSCGRRNQSTVAPQALSMLNSELAVAASEGLANRIRYATDDSTHQIEKLFRIALLRSPSEAETQSCLPFLREQSLEELCRALVNTNEFAFIE